MNWYIRLVIVMLDLSGITFDNQLCFEFIYYFATFGNFL